MSTSRIRWWPVLFASAVAAGLVVLLWRIVGWGLGNAALVGDASAPFGAILTLGALAVAFFALRQQQDALEAELRYRRHDRLRDAYRELVDAVEGYLVRVQTYQRWLKGSGWQDDRGQRAVKQVGIDDAYARVVSAERVVTLVDADPDRLGLARKLSGELSLEPAPDTRESQQKHAIDLQEATKGARDTMTRLVSEVVKELQPPASRIRPPE